jgi:hypothetical protein
MLKRNLREAVVVVTGASSGISRATSISGLKRAPVPLSAPSPAAFQTLPHQQAGRHVFSRTRHCCRGRPLREAHDDRLQ